MLENDELNTRDLAAKLKSKFPESKMSVATVGRIRKELGWTKTAPRYCQMIRDVNQLKRLEWCKARLAGKEQFETVIFTDESTIQIERHSRRCYHKKGEPRKLKPKPKHPLKIHVWGGISKRGATPIVLFTGILIATRFTKILEQSLLPFIEKSYPEGHQFYQDNDPKHTSKFAQSFFAEKKINWWHSPPESPDLNPIELVWGSMKTYLRDCVKPCNQEELIQGIKDYWKTLTPECCCRYINHLQRVMPAVVIAEGKASGF